MKIALSTDHIQSGDTVQCLKMSKSIIVFNWRSILQAQTLKRVEDAGEEENKCRERSKVQEGQTPSCPKEAAEAPDAEKSHPVRPPFFPGSDLPVDQEEHHKA